MFASLKLSAERQVRLIRCTPLDEISNTLSPRQMEVGELDGAQLALEQVRSLCMRDGTASGMWYFVWVVVWCGVLDMGREVVFAVSCSAH